MRITKMKFWLPLLVFVSASVGYAQNIKKCSLIYSEITAKKTRLYNPALELAEKGTEYDRVFWKRFSEEFQEQTRNQIFHNREMFAQAKSRGDSHLLFLENLGFIFNFSEYKVHVPPLLEVIQKIQFLIQKNIENGLIDPKDALFPKMVVTATHFEHIKEFNGNQNPEIDSKYTLRGHLVEPGGKLPIKNYFLENSSSHGSSNFLSDKDFHRLISLGFFPVGGLQSANIGGRYVLNEVMHDLAHWSAMILDPSYMAAVKRNSQRMLKKNLKPVDKDSFLLDFIAYESLVVVRPEKVSEVPKFLGLEGLLKRKKNPSLVDIENYYSSLSEENLLKLTEVMRKQSFKFFTAIGGAQRDLVSYMNLPEFQFPHLQLLANAAGTEGFPGKDPKPIATFAYFVLYTKDLSAGQFMEILTSEKYRNHPAVQMILRSYQDAQRR